MTRRDHPQSCGTRLSLIGVVILFTWSGGPAALPEPQARSTRDEAASARSHDREILGLAPADAWFIAYAANIEKTSKSPIFERMTGGRRNLAGFVATVMESFGGPAVLAISGTPDNPTSWRLTFAARTVIDQSRLFQRLSEDIVQAWNRSGMSTAIGNMQFIDDGRRGYLTLAHPLPLLLTLVTRDGVVFGSTTPLVVEDWQRGTGKYSVFTDSNEFRRLSAGRSGPLDTFIYLDLRTLIPQVAVSLNQVLPRLYEALQLDVIESIACLSGAPTAPSPLRVAVGVREMKPGLWHLLASTPSQATLARAFPPDTTLLVEGSMKRASGLVDDIRAFIAVIDQEIADEYDQERVEFVRETGLDPQSDILGNFVQAWAFGVGGNSDGSDDPLLAAQLESPATFKTHLQTLRDLYRLETSSMSHRGVIVERAVRETGPFSYAVVDNLLLVSPDSKIVLGGIDAILDGKGLDHTRAFNAVRRRTGPQTSKFIYLNLAELFPYVPESEDIADVPGIDPLAKAGTAIGLAVVPHERMIALELASSDDTAEEAMALIWRSVDASLERARYLSARSISMANVKGLLTACHVYAANHNKQWPPSLEILVQSTLLGDEAAATTLLSNPYQDGAAKGEGCYYLYRHIADPTSVEDPAAEVVISEPEIHDGGAVFGFMDGHTEWITSPRADKLLAIMRSGR